jgi:hypothetical protein
MVKTGRARSARLVLLLSAALTAASVAFAAPVADAGPLEGLTGPVKEVTETVTAPVTEVTKTLTPPVQEATETVTQPVHEVTETAPPVHGATEKVTQPVKEAAEVVKPAAKQVTETVTSSPVTAPVKAAAGTAVHTVTNTTGSSSGGAGKDAGTVLHEATGTANHTAARVTHAAEESVGSATRAASSSASAVAASGTYRGSASGLVTAQASGRSGTSSAAADAGPGEDTFDVPTVDGSVRAPLGRLMAYVWPAIALTQPALAGMLEDLGQIPALRLALETLAAAGSGQGPVVAGVHASGGQLDPSSGRSLFSKIPSAVRNLFTPTVPLPMMVGLLAAAVGVLAVFLAFAKELGFFDRYRYRRDRL